MGFSGKKPNQTAAVFRQRTASLCTKLCQECNRQKRHAFGGVHGGAAPGSIPETVTQNAPQAQLHREKGKLKNGENADIGKDSNVVDSI
jgi:hypothetical protein